MPTLSSVDRLLNESAPRFDVQGHLDKQGALDRLAQVELVATPALLRVHDRLLFLLAHPSSARMHAQIERELVRLAAWLKPRRGRLQQPLLNQGLPWIATHARFSHDCLRWLLDNPEVRVSLAGFESPRQALGSLLALTLPSLERSATTAGFDAEELFEALQVPPAQRLAFLVDEFARLDAKAFVKDELFAALDAFVWLQPADRRFSKAFNRLDGVPLHVHGAELLRLFDAPALMNRPLPTARRLDDEARSRVLDVVRTALALTVRETDPVTYADERSLRVWDLEHGLTVVLMGMVPARQLPLDSYVGFMLFKNGLAVAYGGAWPRGRQAEFGMNIFEPFRGGESGYMMCQVLRTYRQCLRIDRFEVDAHQFGRDNPDGIASGAFWFYWRHGFRPVDRAIARRAEGERRRLEARPGARSSEKTLIEFTGSNMALCFGDRPPALLPDLAACVSRHVRERHRGRRAEAEQAALGRFVARTGARARGADEQHVLSELALLAAALPVENDAQLALMKRMVRAKPRDLFAYQRLMVAWLDLMPRGRS